MSRIKRVRIEHFKRFECVELALTPLNCIIGANNSGKSTLLHALALFDFAIHHCLARKNGADSPLTTKNRSIAPEDFFVLPVANPIDLWTDKKTQANNKHLRIQIHVDFDNEQQVSVTIDLNHNRFQITPKVVESQDWLQQLQKCRVAYLPIFSSFLTQEERRTPAIIEDSLARGRVNSVMRNLLLDLKETNKIADLVEILQRAFPNINRLDVRFDETVNRFIDVQYQEHGKKKQFDLFMAGSGFQQFVYLFGFILLRDPDVILLDEPDVHLHGALQGTLLDELKRLVDGGKQIVLATHSRDLINRVEPADIISLDISPDSGVPQRLRVRYDVYDSLDALGSFDHIQMAKLGAFRRVLVVEDESDWKLLQRFGHTALGERRWLQAEQRLALWYAKGNPAFLDCSKLRDQLSQTFHLSGEPLRLWVLSDRDYCPEREALMKKKSDGSGLVTLHLWECAEIENHLLQYRPLERFLKDLLLTEHVLAQEFKTAFEYLIDEMRDEVIIKCTNAIKNYERKEKKSREDDTTFQRQAQQWVKDCWERDRYALTDAKLVLGKAKEWFQSRGVASFSNEQLAATFTRNEIPQEVAQVLEHIATFVCIDANG